MMDMDEPMVAAAQPAPRRQEALVSISETQTVASIVPNFSGDPTKYREWEKALDKAQTLLNAAPDKKMYYAFQRSSSVVSDFIQRFLDSADPRERTWTELRNQLTTRFAEVVDPQYALALLWRTRQGKQESVPVYGERLFAIAQDAYTAQDMTNPAIERQLVATFIDGLNNEQMKFKLTRENPPTFEQALIMAANEQNLLAKFNLRKQVQPRWQEREETPMEVSRVRDKVCRRCGIAHRSRECMQVNSVQLRCFNCNSPTHLARECKERPKNRSKVCWSCNQPGHLSKFCRNRKN